MNIGPDGKLQIELQKDSSTHTSRPPRAAYHQPLHGLCAALTCTRDCLAFRRIPRVHSAPSYHTRIIYG